MVPLNYYNTSFECRCCGYKDYPTMIHGCFRVPASDSYCMICDYYDVEELAILKDVEDQLKKYPSSIGRFQLYLKRYYDKETDEYVDFWGHCNRISRKEVEQRFLEEFSTSIDVLEENIKFLKKKVKENG